MTRIILASASGTRIAILSAAGVSFEVVPAAIDERSIEAPLAASGKPAHEVALGLAEAKAMAVGRVHRDAFVIGADQTLECEGQRFAKPANLSEARAEIESLAGKTHALHAGLAGVKRGEIVWRHVDTARLTMRRLTASQIDAYLSKVGDAALQSVGAYQIEGPGMQLFERIEGDYFTILGLPILPVLKWLRQEGALS